MSLKGQLYKVPTHARLAEKAWSIYNYAGKQTAITPVKLHVIVSEAIGKTSSTSP